MKRQSLKMDCPTAYVKNGSIASDRIVASDNSWGKKHPIWS